MTIAVLPVQDLEAIRQRLTVRLTPDGAFNHYYNDVALLLDALQATHDELGAVRASFEADGAVAPENASLSVLAEAWKGQATGFWEKAQTKKLRSEIANLKAVADELDTTLVLANRDKDQLQARLAELDAQLAEQQHRYVTESQALQAQILSEQEEQVRLRDEIVAVNNALAECARRCEQAVAIQSAQYGAQIQEASEYAKRLVELLGGSDAIAKAP